MKLPPELVQNVAGKGDFVYEKTQWDKRQAHRIPVARRAIVLRKKGQITAVIREMSASGVSLLCSEPMKAGDEFILCLPRQQGDSVPVKCRTVRNNSAGTGGGVFVIGATFTELVRKTADMPQGEPAEAERIRRAVLDI